jgi:hypothetical protein
VLLKRGVAAGARRKHAVSKLLLSRIAGGDTDTSRDYEYTDWKALTDFARRFSASLGVAEVHALPS